MARKKGPEPGTPEYERHKAAAAARQADISRRGRDIGAIPAIVNPERRESARLCFRTFCGYFPATFTLPWSRDHLRVISRIEEVVLRGGLFAVAMPRASGKTSLAEAGCVWATLYRHRRFVVLIGSDKGSAKQMLDSIKSELSSNELLLEDFPEVCYPIARLEGIANRCKGQHCGGRPTEIEWKADRIVLPTIEGSAASGAILRVAGLTGGIRGMKHKRTDGDSVRPDLVIPDDPQTDESAWSLSQCATRERILAGAVLGLAGPNKKISGIMPCTVIRAGDMADNILDRTKHPEWHGERTKMVYSFPANERLWDRYAEIRAEDLNAGGDGSAATEFYRQHRAAMDEGAEVAWPERHHPNELSAVQHAMNLKLQDEAAFQAEYQNEPIRQKLGELEELTPDQIAAKVGGYERHVVPLKANHLTAFIDVQATMLYYTVCAWADDFTGWVIDYGTWPDQQLHYFTARDARRTLALAFPSMGLEGAIHAGLTALTTEVLGRPYRRDDGNEVRIERCLIDANWGEQSSTVYTFCRTSPFAAIMPSHGRGIGASSVPMSEYKKQDGDRCGSHWRIPVGQGKRPIRHVSYDTNYWKSFVHTRLAVAIGDRGCLSLFGDRPVPHRLFAEHLTSEYRVRVEARGRQVDEWKLRPEKPDNHWLDCLVGCAVGASIQGASLHLTEARPTATTKKRKTLAELMRSKPGIRRIG